PGALPTSRPVASVCSATVYSARRLTDLRTSTWCPTALRRTSSDARSKAQCSEACALVFSAGLAVSVEREVRIAIAMCRASPSHLADHDEPPPLRSEEY